MTFQQWNRVERGKARSRAHTSTVFCCSHGPRVILVNNQSTCASRVFVGTQISYTADRKQCGCRRQSESQRAWLARGWPHRRCPEYRSLSSGSSPRIRTSGSLGLGAVLRILWRSRFLTTSSSGSHVGVQCITELVVNRAPEGSYFSTPSLRFVGAISL